MRNLIFLMTYIIILGGCTQPEPVHVSIIVTQDQKFTAQHRILSAFQEWSKSALDLPNSTFTVWYVEGSKYYPHIVLNIPERWPGRLKAQQHAFAHLAQTAIQNGTPLRLPEFAEPPETETRHSVFVISKDASMEREITFGKKAPANVAVILDLSSSMDGKHAIENYLEIYNSWSLNSAKNSTIIFFTVGTGFQDAKKVWSTRIPNYQPGEKVAYLMANHSKLRNTLSHEMKIKRPTSSDILGTLNKALIGFKKENTRSIIILVSDLRLRGCGFNFEKELPAPDVFQTRLKEEMAIDLDGVEVISLSFHPDSPLNTTPLVSSQRYFKIRNLWFDGLQKLNASSIHFLSSCEEIRSLIQG